MEDAMVFEAGDPVDAAKIDEENMVSFKGVSIGSKVRTLLLIQ